MSMRDDLSNEFGARVKGDPVMAAVIQKPGGTIPLGGPVEDVLPAAFGALNTYADALYALILLLGDAVDELRHKIADAR